MKPVIVLGASQKPDRYAFKAMKWLQGHSYMPVPVNPGFDEGIFADSYWKRWSPLSYDGLKNMRKEMSGEQTLMTSTPLRDDIP